MSRVTPVSPPRELPRDLAWLTGLAAVAAVIAALDALGLPLGPLRLVAGLFLALVAPGAALMLAVRPRFLAGTARAVMAIPASLAILALVGIVLDRTSLGIRPLPMAVASGLVTAALLALAWRRALAGPGRGARAAVLVEPVTPAGRAVPADGAAMGATSAEAPAVDTASRRATQLRELLASAIVHVRDPLFLNAYALGISGIVTSGLGVVYWAVAARLYPADIVGINAALLSLVALLANVSQLNLRSGFGRFVPIAGSRTAALIRAGYLAALGLAAITGLGVIGLLAVAPGMLEEIQVTPLLAWLFPITVVLWTAFTVQDHALVALRRTAMVPVENGVFAVAKIALLFPLAGVMTGYGILVSWVIPTAVLVAVVSGWIMLRLVPGAQRAAEAAKAPELVAPPDPAGAVRRDPPVTAKGVVRYVGGDYAGSLFAIGSTSILPVIVLGTLGAESSAHFYMVSLIGMATQLVPTVLATSLLVEVASSNATFEIDGRRVLRQLAALLAPIVLVLVVFAELILGIFGPTYASEGATALRLFALAGIPYALINMAFIRLRLDGRVGWIVAAQAALAVLLVVPALIVLPVFGITGLGAVTLIGQSLVAAVLTWSELRPLLAGILPAGLRWGGTTA